jgi:hypothetical protein
MWRDDGALESYMYYPGKTDVCGDSWLWNRAAGSSWNFVKMYVRMNDVGVLLFSARMSILPATDVPPKLLLLLCLWVVDQID